VVTKHTIYTAEIWFDGRLHGPHRLEVVDGRWSAVSADVAETAPDIALAVAGLVDLHVHCGTGPFAADPLVADASGVVIACSQGDAGWRNLDRWLEAVRPSVVDFRIALNLNPLGEQGPNGSLAQITEADADRTVTAALDHPHEVRMLAVNLSPRSLGDGNALQTLATAISISHQIERPLLVGLATEQQASLAAQLSMLRRGDVITYCYRSEPWCLFPGGFATDGLVEARNRGVLLDTGHGQSSFDMDVARSAIAIGQMPDTISSDLQVATATGARQVTLAVVMRKLIECGMSPEAVCRATTTTPAGVLGVPLAELPDFRLGELARVLEVG
jgi:dihydroorotase